MCEIKMIVQDLNTTHELLKDAIKIRNCLYSIGKSENFSYGVLYVQKEGNHFKEVWYVPYYYPQAEDIAIRLC